MISAELNAKINECLCREFQSVWLIDSKDYTMSVYASNEDASIPGAIGIVEEMNSYPIAKDWYIDNCIMEKDRERVRKMTQIEYLLPRISKDKSFFIEYSRIGGGNINYNQLCFSKIESENENFDYIILGFRDIDIRKRSEIDDLTGLYTRQIFFMKADEMLEAFPNERFDLIISDIVDFKKINENYGVDVADNILRWIGGFLAPAMSDELIIGRYGGDQIVMMGNKQAIEKVAHGRVSTYLQEEKNNGLPDIVTKFGIYEDISHTASIISSCDKAHMALNSIKYHYEKIVAHYDDKLREEMETHRKIENSMHESLKNEDFKVYYQPKHDAVTGKLVGAEALVRWIHPEYGFMSPADFIPLFEHNGFVVEVDNYVFERTCKNIKRWKDKGLNIVPVSVNASKLTFSQDGLLARMQKSVMDNGISPKNIHIEITETLMTEDVDELIRKLTAIRSLGYKIELDDFGAGYSSINILSALPLDIVKLDMSFMKQFGDEKRAKVLVACINLAKELGYKTVSEGVETKEQNDMLGFLGVNYIQGYFYSKPMPEDEFEEYIKEHS